MNDEFNSNENSDYEEDILRDEEPADTGYEYEDDSTYHFSYSSEDNTKWEPDSDKYNTPAPEPPKKKKSKWWIPVAIVMAVIVAAVVVGAIFGFKLIKKTVNNVANQAQISQQITEEVTTAEKESISENAAESHLQTAEAHETIADSGNTGSSIYLTDVSDVVSEVMPAVVSITSRTLVTNGGYGGFFNFYYGNQNSGQKTEVDSGIGSGTIVGQNEKELLILTSYHVVEGSSSLYVTFCDESAVDGTIKAASEEDDIAIVSVKLDDISDDTISQIRMAAIAEEQPDVGDGAIVIGNALGYGQSVVTGIVSALDRQIKVEGKTITVIQTDAAINNGNSGGCLLNSNGEIIGISEAKITSSQVEGMCYAISVNYYYDKIMDMLGQAPSEDTEDQSSTSQGAFLGIYGYDIGNQLADSYDIPEGVYVISTMSGGGAENAGIQEGDVIIGIDGQDISSMSQLQSELSKHEPGDNVKITLMREKNGSYEKVSVNVTLTAAIGQG